MSRRTLSAAVSLAVSALSLAIASPATAGHHHHHGGKTLTCRGPGSLSGGFSLSNHRKVTAKRSDCKTARKVVKRFPKSCSDAYAAQGKCKIRAPAPWRCQSRLAGVLEEGAPSKEVCEHRRSRLEFEVTYSPSIGGPGFTPLQSAKRSGPFNETQACIDTSLPGKVIPPPPLAVAPFEIHTLGGVREATGRALQQSLLDHKVARILNDGLAVNPRAYPNRLPILLTPHKFNPTGWTGLTLAMCGNPQADAIVVRTDEQADKTDSVVAHEMFHAYSDAIDTTETWWEEASATWSQQKDGYPEETGFDIYMQYPNSAIDSTKPDSYPYGMWRFVQFLDDKGFVGGGNGRWQLERHVISGYPQATEALEAALVNQGTNVGEQAAAFWGDRLRAKPLHGPQLVPVKANSNQIEIDPGMTDIPTTAERLHTKLFDFTLAKSVERVTFEFDPPDDGYFWGLVKPKESQRFQKDDSVSFCVDGGDPDTLPWPGHFPVTFTNGSLSTGSIEGTITVRASKDAGQCQLPTPKNRACELLRDAKVNNLLGVGTFPFDSQDSDAQSRTWVCFYTSNSGEVDLNLIRALKLNEKQVRENAKKQIEKLGLRRLKGVGDIAGIGRDTANGKTYNIVVFAVAKEVALFTLSRADDQKAITLAKRLAGQLD